MKKENIIILLLLLSACTYLPQDLQDIQSPFQTGREEIIGAEGIKYQIGIEGLNVKFVKEATPKKVRENSLFEIIFDLQNKGYNDITQGLYKLITEEQYLKVEKNRGTVMLKGKSQYMPKGETKRIKFQVRTGTIDTTLIEFPVKMTLVACYAYETTATEQVCIDPDVEGLKKDKVCAPQDLLLAGGQGAPVAITKIIPTIEMREKGPIPAFEIFIENKGQGQVIAPQYIEHACGAKTITRSADYDTVEIEADISNQRLKCAPSKIKIKSGKETRVYCEQESPLTRRDAYLSPLQIRISYGYQASANGEVSIIKRSET